MELHRKSALHYLRVVNVEFTRQRQNRQIHLPHSATASVKVTSHQAWPDQYLISMFQMRAVHRNQTQPGPGLGPLKATYHSHCDLHKSQPSTGNHWRCHWWMLLCLEALNLHLVRLWRRQCPRLLFPIFYLWHHNQQRFLREGKFNLRLNDLMKARKLTYSELLEVPKPRLGRR